MKIIYLPKTFDSGETLNYHGIYEVSIDTEKKQVTASIGSWSSIADAKKQIKPNVISNVILNYDTWNSDIYDNIHELAFMSYGWSGGTLVDTNDLAIATPALQSNQELSQINQLWLDMANGTIPKVEPFFSEYTAQ